MSDGHLNIAVLQRLGLQDLHGTADLFAPGFVWHCVNAELPELHGDHIGVEGLGAL